MGEIRIEGLTKVYSGNVTALDRLDLTINDGEFFALLGPSGCGKTTLLRTIAGLEVATSGRIHIGERDVTKMSPGDRDVAMVFQDYALFPHMTVSDNIAYPLRIRKVDQASRAQTAARVGAGLGLNGLLERRPGELSGGQQQRVALARAMACEPSAFLFHEPLSNLDARLRLEARTFLKGLQHQLGVTTVFVTHDQAEALAMADRIAVMEAGRLRQLGTPAEIFHRPIDTFVANFIGSAPMTMLDADLVRGRLYVAGTTIEQEVAVRWSGPDPSDGPVVLGIRPEYVRVGAFGPMTVQATIRIVENLGATVLLTAETASGDRLQALVPDGTQPAVGAQVELSPVAERVLLYDEEGHLMTPAPQAAPAPA